MRGGPQKQSYVSIYLSLYLCIYVSMYLCIYVSMYPCIYVSMYLCIYVSMYHDGGGPHAGRRGSGATTIITISIIISKYYY